jgi:hypothetical protein
MPMRTWYLGATPQHAKYQQSVAARLTQIRSKRPPRRLWTCARVRSGGGVGGGQGGAGSARGMSGRGMTRGPTHTHTHAHTRTHTHTHAHTRTHTYTHAHTRTHTAAHPKQVMKSLHKLPQLSASPLSNSYPSTKNAMPMSMNAADKRAPRAMQNVRTVPAEAPTGGPRLRARPTPSPKRDPPQQVRPTLRLRESTLTHDCACAMHATRAGCCLRATQSPERVWCPKRRGRLPRREPRYAPPRRATTLPPSLHPARPPYAPFSGEKGSTVSLLPRTPQADGPQ